MLHGDPGKRAKSQARREPKPRGGRVRCPSWLTPEAKAEWRRLVVEFNALEASGCRLLTLIDAGSLVIAADAYGDFVRAHREIQRMGNLGCFQTKDEDGALKYIVQSPFVTIKRSAGELYLKVMAQFGATPAGRARLSVSQQEAQSGPSQVERDFGVKVA